MSRASQIVAERFELLTIEGSGGMGTVFRAHDRLADQLVAVKLLGADLDAVSAERFAREARVLCDLSHPNIVRYIGHGVDATGERWLAMEWLEGEDLGRRLGRSNRLSIADSVAVGRRAADALGAAHARGIVHRDVKPPNLFLAGGRIEGLKVIDFGVARVGRSGPTRTGDRVGTPRFMAPEQVRGEAHVDARADVFALGCVLYACLTGEHAFPGDEELVVMASILGTNPRPISSVTPIPAALEELVARMLAKAPGGRPADGAAVAAELAALELESTDPTRTQTTFVGDERRSVTVLLLDAHAAPAHLETIVRQYNGRLERIDEDAGVRLVITIASTGVATDQAVRAARLALALRADAPAVAIAISTGIASRWRGGAALARDIALPARGTLLLDEVTAGLLDPRFVVGADGVLTGEREGETTRRLLGKPTPFVGRERELATLRAAFDACVDGPASTAMLVTAPAGVGKSRLRHELLRKLDPGVGVWLASGDPLRAGSPYSLLAPVLRHTAGVQTGEPQTVSRQKLAARVARHLTASQAEQIVPFIGELTGLPFPDDEEPKSPARALRAARRDPALMADHVRHAFEEWLAAECAAAPLVLILEDLHWGDQPTVQLIAGALRRLEDAPLFVLALARPEVHDLFPHLWAARGITEIVLPGLGRKASERLISAVLGDDLPEGESHRLVTRAAGNAFFLEELIRAAAEGGEQGAPETVLAMMQARLDALPAGARRVLRAASLFGEVFWLGGVRALLGGEVDSWLPHLVERELVVRRGEPRFPSEEEYGFRHALVNEAAQTMLGADDARAGHLIAGTWLEAAGETDGLVLGGHYEAGGEPARARGWYRRAAEQALDANDLTASVARGRRAVACGATGVELGELRLLEARASNWRADPAAAEAAARDALALLPEGSEAWFDAVGELAVPIARRDLGAADLAALADGIEKNARGQRAALAAMSRVAPLLGAAGFPERQERFLAVVAAADIDADRDPALAAARLEALAFHTDPCPRLEAALAIHDATGNLRRACQVRANLGGFYANLGVPERGERLLRQAIADADRLGFVGVSAHARFNLAIALRELGRLDLARQTATDARDRLATLGMPLWAEGARLVLSSVLLAAGDLEAAGAEAGHALACAGEIPPLRCGASTFLARVRLAQGRSAEALELARVAMAERTGSAFSEDILTTVELTHAEALWACGDAAAARQAIAAAAARLEADAARISDGELSVRFLAAPTHARVLELGKAWSEDRSQ